MRPVSFGRINVQNHGVPVKMGQSTLNGNVAVADPTIFFTSAAPFCQDMCPFKLDIDPSGVFEKVMVTGISGGITASVQRGIDGTTPTAHVSGVGVFAKFDFAGWQLSAVSGLTGKMYWGRNVMIAGGAGVIKEFVPNPASAAVDDAFEFMPTEEKGNPLHLVDYAMDAAVDGEGLYVTLWER